jgi:hypothetical protein
MEALEPRSRRPKKTPIATSDDVRERVIELRSQLTVDGLDAGPVTIAWHLEQEGLRAPAPATISRILHQAGLITPQPRKRPRSSYLRFEMAQPNEMWQSDFIHWRLADGTDVEILNWLDDHSRYLLSCSVHRPVTGDAVVSGATRSNTSSRCSASARRTGPPATLRRRVRPNGSTRPSSAGFKPGHQPPAPRICSASSTSSKRTTTSAALTAPYTEELPATPTARRPRPRQPAHALPGTTACAMTDSTPKAA